MSTDSGDMPLSQLQIDSLKTPTTVIEIQTDNPKKPGSKAAERFDRYKMATTIQEATNQGANWQDLPADFEKGYLKIRVSAATISASRSMMRDEIRYGMVEMEQHFSAKLRNQRRIGCGKGGPPTA